MKRAGFALALLASLSISVHAANTLRIVSAGPVGETATIAEANEVRVVFSEPMVALGRIPQPVVVPFFRIEPAVKGSFRWSGTTTLIFTPDKPLPFATAYNVTIDKSAKAVSGNTLDQPYRWSFSTPSVKLMRTDWYRKAGGSVVIALWFNQPVQAGSILPKLQLRTRGHELELPKEPAGDPAFEAKKAKALAAAASNDQPVLSFVATDWNKEQFVPVPEVVVIETKPGIPPDTWIQVTHGEEGYTVELEPTLFVTGIDCTVECDPEQRNAFNFRSGPGLRFADVRKGVSVTDITDPAKEKKVEPRKVNPEYDSPSWNYGLDELGFSIQPGHKYRVSAGPAIASEDKQTLGYTFTATIENWHKSAFVSFGSGHGVWEATGGPILPFHARNFRTAKQWLAPLTIEELMPTMLRLRESGFNVTPDTKPATRKLTPAFDKITAVGLDLKPAIGDDNLGIVWAAIQPGDPVPQSKIYDPSPVSTVVQATNLGISVKDSPRNTLIMVTRLEDAKPVAGATVSIRDRDNKVFWTGTTDAGGLAIAPNTDLRRKAASEDQNQWEDSWYALSELHFVVVAEKDGDVAYVGSDWNEGVMPWDFNLRYDLIEADPQFRGTIFVDRGVYKLGEEVHFKAIVRADSADGIQLLPAGTKIDVVLHDSHSKELDKRTVAVNAWSSAEWTFRIPADAPLGTYDVSATTSGARGGNVRGDFLVAAYRRPEFRVDTTLNADSSVAGVKLAGRVNGRYLFGSPMSNRDVSWTYSKIEQDEVPQKITDRWPSERYAFLGRDWSEDSPSRVVISQKDETLDAKGVLALTLETDKAAGAPFEYQLEGRVTDVTRQEIAGRASFRVDPAPWYIGLGRPPYFADSAKGIDTEIVAAGLDGLAVGGVSVKVELKRLQWTSARQAEGDGFYEWDSERKEVPAGEWTITTKPEPVPLHIPIAEGGEYLLIATAEADGRSTRTRAWFYAVGDGYTAWERYDHNRIDLIPEKTKYKPGDTARIMIKSPWEQATALLTTEREGVRTWKKFELTSTQQTITVPITEKEIPNFYVSVLILKGRTKQDPGKDGSDPGKPAFRLGYVELKVEDASKRLNVDVKANRDEFRPATKASIEVNVKDAAGKPSQSEVTLWAVDYGVLSLTGYQPPDVLDTIYLEKALQVSNEESRQRIVSRRVLTPKGASDGGGGGKDAGPGMLRKDFRVLAFWLGSLVTDAKGRAKTEVTLPESLTTYRIMAVAGDKQSRFGHDQAEIRINKPLMLTPSWPRFLVVGDKAYFGGVVHNQLKSGGKATVSIESLDPGVITVNGKSTVDIKPGAPVEVRFDAEAKSIGDARIRMRVMMGRENDAFEDVIPVRVLVSPETVAAYGEANPRAEEKIELPQNVVPGFGGLRVDLSSTAMVGLAEGARYLMEYPYGCAEQRSSRSLGLMLAADLGEAFTLPGIDAAKAKATVQTNLNELERFQCGDGGFAFWAGDCDATSPYLTSYVLHVYQRAKKLGYQVDDAMLTRGGNFLETKLAEPPPTNEGWRPAYNAWQAFAVKVQIEGGRVADSHLNRIYEYRDRMPVFGLAYLIDALQAKGEKDGPRIADLHRRVLNSILPEGGFAFVNELSDPYLLWFWSSNVRSTSIVLGTLVRGGQDEEMVKRMVRWMMKVRKNGRWNDTQENAWALEGLVDYYRKYESQAPDFVGTVAQGSTTLVRETFKGRSTEARTANVPIDKVVSGPVVFTRDGTGTLFYMMRLRYAANVMRHEPLDQGFHVERSYRLQNGDSASTTFKAGDLINVTLRIRNTKERRYVAITDPIPAGTEPVEAWFATTASALAEQVERGDTSTSWAWWERGGFDHVERHDDRVDLFATRLGEGEHLYTYLVRATTAGTFIAAPTHAEEMYEPEVFGRTATTILEVQK
jgi:alpha-2-macroglobulin